MRPVHALTTLLTLVFHASDAQFPAVAQVDPLPVRPVERFVPWFDDPHPLLLQDTLITQCWSNGRQVIFNRGDIGFDLRTVDSCSCWEVRGEMHQDLLYGERGAVADDSSLVAFWRRDGPSLLSCWRVGWPANEVRCFRMDVQDTVRAEIVFRERLDGSGYEEFRSIWFRATEVH